MPLVTERSNLLKKNKTALITGQNIPSNDEYAYF